MRGLFESRFAAVLVGVGIVAAVAASQIPRETGGTNPRVEPLWPAEFEGRELRELPLSEVERSFDSDFPGRIRKFSDGGRVIILRWVTQPTRKLHSSADCFRGLGYEVRQAGVVSDAQGRDWGEFRATRGASSRRVRERITDAAGRSWTEVEAWFWPAALGRSIGPWWAVTVVE